MMQDKARLQTDKKLNRLEEAIGRVYRTNPALLQAEKKYKDYMAMVKKETESAYKAFEEETDREAKEEKKKAYGEEVKKRTLESKAYKKIVEELTRAMAQANQEALELTNKAMAEVYVINHNQIADECRRVGITVAEAKN